MKIYPLLLLILPCAPTLQAETVFDKQARVKSIQETRAATRTATQNLLNAAINGTVEEIKMASDAGAHLSAENKSGMTALMLAATRGRLAIVTYLVEVAKVDVNFKSQNGIARGKTALSLAQDTNQTAVIDYLLQHGAK